MRCAAVFLSTDYCTCVCSVGGGRGGLLLATAVFLATDYSMLCSCRGHPSLPTDTMLHAHIAAAILVALVGIVEFARYYGYYNDARTSTKARQHLVPTRPTWLNLRHSSGAPSTCMPPVT